MIVALCNYDYYINEDGPVWFATCIDEKGNDVVLMVQDERIAPNFYILEKDRELALKVWKEKGIEKLASVRHTKLRSALDEKLMEVVTKYPSDVSVLRDAIDGLLTFQADIKWEKNVVQRRRWKEFLEIKDYNPYRMTPLDNISNAKTRFLVKRNILYWDIETDSKGVRQFSNWRFADKMAIISYATFSSKTQSFIWYGWKPEWETAVEQNAHKSAIPVSSKFRRKFKDYPATFPLTIKKFSNEKDMHLAFINDVAFGHYHGIMTFNGRGGNRIIRGKRKWFDGFDSQMFFERCRILGLEKEIQRMSPVPVKKNGNYILMPSVKSLDQFENNEQVKHEIYFKCMPMHDLLFDDNILFYTKEEYEMKRHNLDTYMVHFLDAEKVKHKGSSVAELFAKDWQKEMYYNCVDVEGMVALDMNFNYTNDVAGRALLYGGKIEDGVYASKIHDHINLWFSSSEYIMESRDNAREDSWQGMIAEKKGGFNLNPKVGLYGYDEPFFAFMLDFSKLYPTCAMTANADLRTKINLKNMRFSSKGLELVDTENRAFLWDDCARSPSGFFRKDILSLNTQIYQELIKERKVYSGLADEFKSKFSKETDPLLKGKYWDLYKLNYSTQFSYKGLINGKYGAEGLEGTRMFDKVTYNTPPSMGQEIIKFVIFEALPKLGYSVENGNILFSSTDSVLVVANEKKNLQTCIAEAESVTSALNNMVKVFVEKEFNPIKSYVKLECEKIADVCMLYDMRRYMLNLVAEEKDDGWLIHKEPRPFWKGIEKIRRDSAAITGEVQTIILDMIRKHKPMKEIEKYIIELDETFDKKAWELICPRASISNNLDDIEIENQRYKAIDNANKYFDKNYSPGDAPLLGVFTKHPSSINGLFIEGGKFVLAFDEEDEYPLKKLGFDLDYTEIKQKNVVDKIDSLLTFFGDVSYNTIINNTRGSFLEA